MLHAPVLKLDVGKMHEIDPRNVESLFGMWTVFSKCSSTIPDGKRLENLSWRVWARETLCCPPQPEKTIVPSIDISLPQNEEVPSLSSSLSSDSDETSLPSRSSIGSLENSALSKSRGKEPHLTPHTLEKIVVNIQENSNIEKLDPEIVAVVNAKMSPELKAKQQQEQQESSQSTQTVKSDQPSSTSATESSIISTVASSIPENDTTKENSPHRGSDTSVSSDGLIRSGSVVHGFSPMPSLRSRTSLSYNLPLIASKNAAAKTLSPKKKGNMFTLGCSSDDEDSSFEARMSYRRSIMEPRKSSLSHSVSKDQPHPPKKTTFKEVLEESGRPIAGSAVASDDEDESAIDDSAVEDESAIEDDDDEGDDEDGDWEDSPEGDEEKHAPEPIFRRVDSSAHLPSRRSILTAGLTEGERAKGLLSAATRSSPALQRMQRAASHTGPALPSSPENDNEDSPMMMQMPRGARPITINSSSQPTYAAAHSPRTTRRHMLSTELTESLRKNLLWERQQKNTTVNAFLRREARSMANLPQAGQMAGIQSQPARPLRDASRNDDASNDFFNVTNDYNTQGW